MPKGKRIEKMISYYYSLLPYTKEYNQDNHTYTFRWWRKNHDNQVDSVYGIEQISINNNRYYDPQAIICDSGTKNGGYIVIHDDHVIEALSEKFMFIPNKFNKIERDPKYIYPVFCTTPQYTLTTQEDMFDQELHTMVTEGRVKYDDLTDYLKMCYHRYEDRVQQEHTSLVKFHQIPIPVYTPDVIGKLVVPENKAPKIKLCEPCTRICQMCKKPFTSKRSLIRRSEKIYCSKACANSARVNVSLETNVCKLCNTTYKSVFKEDFCCQECEAEYKNRNS